MKTKLLGLILVVFSLVIPKALKAGPGHPGDPPVHDYEKLTGKVVDDENNPLPGATIVIKGTSAGTVTDVDGNFTLEVSLEDVIVISFLGYQSQEITVRGFSFVTIQMVPDAAQLEEIVVIGYGSQARKDLSGSIDAVTAADVIENRGISNSIEALEGRVAGLNVSPSAGTNPSASFNIRGVTTISGSGNPLILVDNIPVDPDVLIRMNPEDIESFTVLKDAAAAAIYGGRASFGVILVTTKKGKANALEVTFNSNTRISRQTLFPEWVDTHTHMVTRNQAQLARDNSTFFSPEVVEAARLYKEDPANNPLYEIDNPVYDANGNIIGGTVRYYGTVDFMDETYKRNLLQQKFDLSVSAGSENSSIYSSLGYISDEGVYRVNNDKLDIYNFRLNTETQINDWLNVGVRTAYIRRDFERPFQYLNYWDQNYSQRTYFPLINPTNGFPLQHVPGYLESGAGDDFQDDDLTLNLNTTVDVNENFKVVGNLSYRNVVGLNTESKYQITFADNFAFNLPVDALWNARANNSHIRERTSRTQEFIVDVFGDYSNTFGDHFVNLVAGFNQQSFNDLFYFVQRRGVISESVPSLNLTLGEPEDVSLGQSESHWAIRGGFLRASYDYKNKYLFQFNGRYDGTSRFAEDSRFGLFASASGAWRISEESFMDFSSGWLNDLKLRASYGSIGNQSGASTYAYIATMDTFEPGVLLGGTEAVAVSTPDLVDPSITWENVETTNIGLDVALLGNRLSMSLDLFRRLTKDMRVDGARLPGFLGTDAPETNAADLETEGFETTIAWNDRIGNKMRYGIRFNLSDSRAFITKYDNNPNQLISDFYVGQELGEIWGYETEGFFQSEDEAQEALAGGSHDQSAINGIWKPGDIKYRDLNGDGRIDQGANTVDDPGDRRIIGNNRARYIYGVNVHVDYKNFRFEAFGQGVMKRNLFTANSLYFPYYSRWDNVQQWQLNNSWTPENPNAFFPQFEADVRRNYQTQTRYLQNFAYFRLTSLSISYSFSNELLSKIPIVNEATITLSGRNLFEVHDILGDFDPQGNGSGFTEPFRRIYSAGLRLKF